MPVPSTNQTDPKDQSILVPTRPKRTRQTFITAFTAFTAGPAEDFSDSEGSPILVESRLGIQETARFRIQQFYWFVSLPL
jgi:hypothetical protein